MSWDLYVQNLPPGIQSVTEIPDDFDPDSLGISRAALIEAVRAAFPTVDARDPSWLVADGDSWSITFNVGADDPVASIALHVRGDRPPVHAIAQLLDGLGVRAIDPQADSGLFDVKTATASFASWAAFRDRVIRPDG